LDFRSRHAVVTGGTGALGTAVVAALLERGATCHIPTHGEEDTSGLAYATHERVKFYRSVELADQDQTDSFYSKVGNLWASIHLA
jgi:NAD(P)-dependent dehydrogenase (short-subunit alcohol dehydrogenase family)